MSPRGKDPLPKPQILAKEEEQGQSEIALLPEETALDAALIVLENGGSTNLAEYTFHNILRALRTEDSPAEGEVAPVWRMDFVAIGGGSRRHPILRRVGNIGFSLSRASEAMMIGERAARGTLNGAAIVSEVDRIKNLTAPRSMWITILAAACSGAFFTRTADGDDGALGIAFVAAAIGQLARSLLGTRKVGILAGTAIAAIISATIATAALRLGFSKNEGVTLLGAIIYLVPGMSLANGFVDLISEQHMLVGIERLLRAFLIFMILTLSLVFADALL